MLSQKVSPGGGFCQQSQSPGIWIPSGVMKNMAIGDPMENSFFFFHGEIIDKNTFFFFLKNTV
jgi:hypothetical protein